MTRERYAVVVFEREAPLRGGQGVRVTPMDVEPYMLSNIEDAVAWYGTPGGFFLSMAATAGGRRAQLGGVPAGHGQ